ncbi:hypothetical protein QRX50_24530 [Amycolatopsis carbonis]|uniref:Uncharacterized protein n=1 Tax=Amycolatopsis carbonis TaxID=715471 RepID=A0A9Y2MYN8_9PSEU|nr:hypothetical protein [Amycolatopsis sp. 2-15]WIX83696.1 hypothetical protein QRX50_24530 [Amycolatopsis sp. 2-15]
MSPAAAPLSAGQTNADFVATQRATSPDSMHPCPLTTEPIASFTRTVRSSW